MSRNCPARVQPVDFIVRVRGQSVIMDSDLAALYGVETRQLNQQVRRNTRRFPKTFAFQLTMDEYRHLRSQVVILKQGQHRKYPPHVFTEHGVVMAANVLKSERAIEASIAVVEAFVRLRRMALSVESLARKVNALENKYDENFAVVFDAIRQLMAPPDKPRGKIGFYPRD